MPHTPAQSQNCACHSQSQAGRAQHQHGSLTSFTSKREGSADVSDGGRIRGNDDPGKRTPEARRPVKAPCDDVPGYVLPRSAVSPKYMTNVAGLILVCALLVLVLSLATGAGGATAAHHDRERRVVVGKGFHPDEFLEHFGYFPKGRYPPRLYRVGRRRAVSLYQQNNGLRVTGKINRRTWRLMQKPRCGNPDIGVQPLPDTTSSNRSAQSHRFKRSVMRKAKQVDKYDFRWLQRGITWSPTRFLYKLPASSQWTVMKRAFAVWSEPSQLSLTYDPVNPDIRVSFLRRDHGDGYSNAFDGRGGLLAHAFPPGELDMSGDIHFDSDEKWVVDRSSSGDSKDLLMTAMHEVGHAIGLSHSTRSKDIMYPVYGTHSTHPSLSRHDVRRLRRLYGKNPAFRWKPPKSSSPAKNQAKPSARRVKPRWCRMPFNDVIRGPYGRSYIFSKRYVYRVDSKGVEKGYPLHVRHEFPGAPINALAVVHVREGTLTFFFKGKRLWRFTNHTLDPGYPRVLLPPFPEKPRTALSIRDRKGYSTVYIFGSRFFWQWNHVTERVSSAFLHISSFWPKLPARIDAAVHWTDSYIYFFKNNKYFKFSRDRHRLQTGYPKTKGPAWLRGDCGTKPK